MVWFLQLSLWSKNLALNFKRNKDLTFIMIIIDIDWYEKNYRDNFLGHIAQPYIYIYIYTIKMSIPAEVSRYQVVSRYHAVLC